MMDNQILFFALDALQEAVFLLNRDRRILFANRRANEEFGGQFVGDDFVKVIRHPDCIGIIDTVINGKKSGETAITVDRPTTAVIRVLVTALTDLQGDPEGNIIVSIADISNIREAEQMRTDFVANVSHELRSPLTAISGFIETLKGSARDDQKARERFLNLLEHESQRMVWLITDLLSLSKVEASQRVRPTGTANIGAILNRIVNSLASVADVERKTVRINIPQITDIPGSTDEMTQVFQNLIENAIKYGKRDSEVHVNVLRQEVVAGMAGPSLQIDVIDQGDGIAREHIARLTERFYRVDNHRSRDKGGTGLGLAIVKHIVNRHRGRLKISSVPGEGSTFTVILPLQ